MPNFNRLPPHHYIEALIAHHGGDDYKYWKLDKGDGKDRHVYAIPHPENTVETAGDMAESLRRLYTGSSSLNKTWLFTNHDSSKHNVHVGYTVHIKTPEGKGHIWEFTPVSKAADALADYPEAHEQAEDEAHYPWPHIGVRVLRER